MKITSVSTHLVGNRWKNWLFVRVDTDEGIHGLGEGTINGFGETVRAAIHEIESLVVGRNPFAIDDLVHHLERDLYTDGGQIQKAAIASIETACWDIKGKALGVPVWELLGGLVRDRIPVYANGWYQVDRTPDAFADAARSVVAAGFDAMKFDPFGAVWRTQSPRELDLSIAIVEAVRASVGPEIDLMIEGHNRFSPAAATTVAERLTASRPAWFEEPVPHQRLGAMIEVARRSPVPIATGESYTSVNQFAELMSHDVVSIFQPEPLNLGGIARTRVVAGMADAHYGLVAPHNAQGPVCSAISMHLGASTPNFYYQESFDVFNEPWTRHIIVGEPLAIDNGQVVVSHAPGLGIDLDWEALDDHPHRAQNVLKLFEPGWERRRSADER